MFEFKLPEIGEGVIEGEIVRWLRSPGEGVGQNQALVEVMTDKATVEVPSPVEGVLKEHRAAEGDICAIGSVLCLIETGASASTAKAPPASPSAASKAPPATPKAAPVVAATVAPQHLNGAIASSAPMIPATPAEANTATPIWRTAGIAIRATQAVITTTTDARMRCSRLKLSAMLLA